MPCSLKVEGRREDFESEMLCRLMVTAAARSSGGSAPPSSASQGPKYPSAPGPLSSRGGLFDRTSTHQLQSGRPRRQDDPSIAELLAELLLNPLNHPVAIALVEGQDLVARPGVG